MKSKTLHFNFHSRKNFSKTMALLLFFAFLSISKGYSQSGSALNFDGIDDRVSMPNQPVSNLINFTLEAWVNTSTNTAQAIYSEGNASDDNPMFSLISMPNATGFEIVLRNEFGVGLVVSSTIGFVPLNTWTHVTFARTSATTANLYINGVITDSFVFADPGSIFVNVANIGVRQRVVFDGFFNGAIDEVRIWNRTLPQAEIANNMNCELGANQTGLLSYYKFNQGIDNADNTAITSLTDASGNTNTGALIDFTLTGASSNWVATGGVTTGIQCTTASALSFDGIDDYVNCGNSTLLNVTGSLSVEAFVYRSILNTDDCIIGKDIFATSTGYSFWVYQNNKLVFRLGNREYQSISSISQNTWTHVAATFEAGEVKLYINGVLDATYTSVAPPVSNTNGLYLGTPQDAVGNSFFAFSGKMDEVRVWNRGLEQCEIQNNMNGELTSGQTGLLAYYQFNQGIDSQDNTATTNLADLSGNNFNGTLTNFTLTGATSNWVTPGGVTTGTTSPVYNSLIVATTQTLFSSSTVANLTAIGTNINWYDVPVGGTALVSITALTSGTYYVTQTPGTCESDRTAVQVNIIGSALQFDGSNDKVVIGNSMNSILNPINTITVEAWVNPTNTTFNGVIVGNYYNSNNEMQFLLRRDFDTFSFWVNDGTGFKAVDSGLASVVVNTWQHVVGVWDGSSLYIYVDGVLKGTTAGVNGSSFASTSNDIVIGSNSYPENFAGSIDELRIWNRALNQCEIQNNMNGELASGQTDLLAYYQFNQGIASADNTGITSLTDSSGNNYNGTLTNFALTGTTSNWVSPGAIITNTVSPTYDMPNVNAITSMSVCNNSVIAPIIFSSSTTGTLCGQTNEGGTITLTAPVGSVFTSIPFASYGTPNGTCGNYTFGGCHASNSSFSVSALALGQNSFSILANNTTFGDPCAFIAKRMYIEAVYNNTTFNWTNDTPSIGLSASGTGSIPSFTAVNSGSTPVVATITVTPMINGCAGTPVQFTLTVNPIPSTPSGSSTQVINGGVAVDATIEDIVVNPTTVTWYASSSDALAGTNVLPTGTQLVDGAEYFAVNQENGCSSTSFAVTVTVVLGNDTFDANYFNYYPNPVVDNLHITYNKNISSVQIFDLTGRMLKSVQPNTQMFDVNLTELSSAMYLVKLTDENNTQTEIKIFKK